MYPFNGFSQDMINHLLPGQRAYQDILLGSSLQVESVSAAGALSLTTLVTELAVVGTMAFTLAAPTVAGQIKKVMCISAATTPLGTLTISSPDNVAGFVCPATVCFTAPGQSITFEATSALRWRCVSKVRAGVTALVVGTTVTTGICDMTNVDLSVTGTVSSTTTRALPNGAAVGEIVSITVSTAATTPAGTLGGTYQTKAGANTGTTLSLFGAVTDNALLQWNGSAWKPLILAPTTLVVA